MPLLLCRKEPVVVVVLLIPLTIDRYEQLCHRSQKSFFFCEESDELRVKREKLYISEIAISGLFKAGSPTQNCGNGGPGGLGDVVEKFIIPV